MKGALEPLPFKTETDELMTQPLYRTVSPKIFRSPMQNVKGF